jgi:hypothetical protein
MIHIPFEREQGFHMGDTSQNHLLEKNRISSAHPSLEKSTSRRSFGKRLQLDREGSALLPQYLWMCRGKREGRHYRMSNPAVGAHDAYNFDELGVVIFFMRCMADKMLGHRTTGTDDFCN